MLAIALLAALPGACSESRRAREQPSLRGGTGAIKDAGAANPGRSGSGGDGERAGSGGRGGRADASTAGASGRDAAMPIDAGPLREVIPGDAGMTECPGPTPWNCALPTTDLSGIGELTVSAVPRPQCPERLPTAGDACSIPSAICGYGNRARADCRAMFVCRDGAWQDDSPVCLGAPPGFCPQTPAPIGEACEVTRFASFGLVPVCEYGDDVVCFCGGFSLSDPHVWRCNLPPADARCPRVSPNFGEGCSVQALECEYGGPCNPGGGRWFCRNGAWEPGDEAGNCSEG